MIDQLAKNHYFVFFVFLMLVLVVYVRSLTGGYIFDDQQIILRDASLKAETISDFLKILQARERPLRLVSFFIDSKIWGLNPFGFRFTNVIIHSFNGLLLYLLSLKINCTARVAVLSATIFLLHPMMPSAVAYITGRKELLGVMFALLSILSYLKYSADKRVYLLVALTFFLLSVMCKEMFITLPVVYFVIDKYIMHRKINLFAVTLLSAATIAIPLYLQLKGFRTITAGNIYEKLLIPGYFFQYIVIYCAPFMSKMDYAGYFTIPSKFSDVQWSFFLFRAMFSAAFATACIILWKRNKTLSVFLVLFGVSLLPVLQIIPHSEKFSDHYLYFPSLFLALATGIAGTHVVRRDGRFLVSMLLLVLIFGYGSYRKTLHYMDNDAYWQEAYRRNPESYRALYWVGMNYKRLGETHKAEHVFTEGLKKVKSERVMSELAATFYYDYLNELSFVSRANNDLETAERYILEGLETLQDDTYRQIFVFNLALIRMAKDPAGIEAQLLALIRTNEKYQFLKYLLYDYYWSRGMGDRMNLLVDETIRLYPDSHFAIAKKCLNAMKRNDSAGKQKWCGAAHAVSPSNYYELNDRAEIEIFEGKYDQARRHLMMALEENPDYARTGKNIRILDDSVSERKEPKK